MEEEGGYSGIFYVMLIIGIIGVLGFFIVAAGAARQLADMVIMMLEGKVEVTHE